MKDVKIYVTQEHIDNSNRFCEKSCMIANAMYDAGFKKNISVESSYILGTGKNNTEKWYFDKKVRNNIICYDNGQLIEPFSFIIKNVDEEFLVRK